LFYQPTEVDFLWDINVLNPIGRGIKSILERTLPGCCSIAIGPQFKGTLTRDNFTSFKNIYINSCFGFLEGETDYSFIKPTESVNSIVENISKNIRSNTCGIHIRRAEPEWSVKNPSSFYINQIDNLINVDSSVTFYLSTDSVEEEDCFKKAYGDRIIVYQKRSLNRGKASAIEDALIDLICLSKTSRIIGTYGSSFSEIASRLGSIPLYVPLSG
jgi:hypothetical protein